MNPIGEGHMARDRFSVRRWLCCRPRGCLPAAAPVGFLHVRSHFSDRHIPHSTRYCGGRWTPWKKNARQTSTALAPGSKKKWGRKGKRRRTALSTRWDLVVLQRASKAEKTRDAPQEGKRHVQYSSPRRRSTPKCRGHSCLGPLPRRLHRVRFAFPSTRAMSAQDRPHEGSPWIN